VATNIFRVILPKYKLCLLDYTGVDETYAIGDFVKVPFRNKEIIGVVWKKLEFSSIDSSKLKSIKEKLDLPSLSENFIKFANWICDYTISEPGAVLKLIMPKEDLAEQNKIEALYQLSSSFDVKITKHRRIVIEFLSNLQRPISLKEISFHTGVPSYSLTSMKNLHIIEEVTSKHFTPSTNKITKNTYQIRDSSLTSEQHKAVLYIQESLNQGQYKTILLDGVTGSGKTEVYFEIIKTILADNKGQVLLLLPEIFLTTQLISRFKEKFGFQPAIWHSEISDKNKKQYWHGILSGEIKILIGARSALFLPFKSLKLIIVDEEHETSYKQEEGVIYNARDLAVSRGYHENITVILASATPAIETLQNVQLAKYSSVELPNRFGTAGLPNVTIIDLKKEALLSKQYVSDPLRQAIINNYNDRLQTIVFLNRRGYAPYTICTKCGKTATCPDCSVSLSYHKHKNILQCHYCNFIRVYEDICIHCLEKECLNNYGPGVEKIEEEIKSFLPDARTVIITRDTINSLSKSEQALNLITEGKVDIIIGTQMIAKGHHFSKLTLVGVIDADFGFSSLDLRANEKTYQLLYQICGRAGREEIKGQVLLQTYNPENPVLSSLLHNNRTTFIASELEDRRFLNLPPFSKLVALIIYGVDEKLVIEYATNLRKKAISRSDFQILGPVPAPIPRIKSNYRYRILIKSDKSINIQKYISTLISALPRPNQVKMKIDVDPYSFL
jgi:primosomal protein N' (replication factor Y)